MKLRGRTYCQDCMYAESAREPRWWMCKMAPMVPQYKFVTHDFIHESAPFMRCEIVNPIGNCAMFEEKNADSNDKG